MDGLILLFDGAFGTYYYEKTGDAGPCELANLYDEGVVLGIHREYIRAGAGAIKTNTFGSNPSVYDREKLARILTKGYRLAELAAEGGRCAVFADIGGIRCDNAEELPGMYLRLTEIFVSLGARDFLFETMAEFAPAARAIELIGGRVKGARVLVSFAVSHDGYTQKGLHYKGLIAQAAAHPAVSFAGLNCVCGPSHLLRLVKELGHVDKPLAVMPNSGYPSDLNGRIIFEDNARYFADKMRQLYDCGARVLGGCCGTTPLHIELTGRMLSERAGDGAAASGGAAPRRSDAQGSRAARRLCPKPLFIELPPPTDCDFESIASAAGQIGRVCNGVCFTFPDSPLSKARADSILTAAKLKTETGADVMPHLTCRDKNHIAIKAGLLGAAMFGIDKILAVTGDPFYDNAQKKSGVFDFNSLELISYLDSLNREVFRQTPFAIGAALNVNARNFDAELARCLKKVENGARRLFTQPICTQAAIQNFRTAKGSLAGFPDCELIAGVMPFASYKNALFLNNEVSGVCIPQGIIDDIRDKPAEEVYRASAGFCAGVINGVYECADGFYITVPLRKTELVRELIVSCFDI